MAHWLGWRTVDEEKITGYAEVHRFPLRQAVPHSPQSQEDCRGKTPYQRNRQFLIHMVPLCLMPVRCPCRVATDPIATPIASPTASQKIQLPDNIATSAPAINPKSKPGNEIFFITSSPGREDVPPA